MPGVFTIDGPPTEAAPIACAFNDCRSGEKAILELVRVFDELKRPYQFETAVEALYAEWERLRPLMLRLIAGASRPGATNVRVSPSAVCCQLRSLANRAGVLQREVLSFVLLQQRYGTTAAATVPTPKPVLAPTPAAAPTLTPPAPPPTDGPHLPWGAAHYMTLAGGTVLLVAGIWGLSHSLRAGR